MNNVPQYPPTELVLNQEGHVYHLGLSPESVADTVILVGDQDRVELAASLFDSVEHASQHREFVCKTGSYKEKRITVLSTGIGTDNIDITLNELDALKNIDLKTRSDKPTTTSLKIVRIGTCGILQPEIEVHSYLLTTHAFGLDNIAHFYSIPYSEEELLLRKEIENQVTFPAGIAPYLVSASKQLTSLLSSPKTASGVTITSSGFYGPQGRQLRLSSNTNTLNDELTAFSFEGHKIVNFEMESSALFALGKALGHECATICLGIANRPKKDFSKGYQSEMVELIRYVFDRI